MTTATLNVTGMHCSSCSMLVNMEISDLVGVQSVDCNHATGRTEVTFDAEKVSTEDIVRAIANAGYGAEFVG